MLRSSAASSISVADIRLDKMDNQHRDPPGRSTTRPPESIDEVDKAKSQHSSTINTLIDLEIDRSILYD